MSLIPHTWNSRNLMKETGLSIQVWTKVWTLYGPVKAKVLSIDGLGHRIRIHLAVTISYTNMVCRGCSYKTSTLPDGTPLTFISFFFNSTMLFLSSAAARCSWSLETYLWDCLWCLSQQKRSYSHNKPTWLMGKGTMQREAHLSLD